MTISELVCGILHTDSKTCFTTTQAGVKKLFTPYNSKYQDIHVNTRKIFSAAKYYVVVNYTTGDLVKYIGEVGDFTAERNYLLNIVLLTRGNIKIPEATSTTLSQDTRIDLTHLETYSIDPVGCDDIDDALSINDNIVYIHIADVSSYIASDSELDKLIRLRSETIYFPHKKYNMLPDALMQQCSLVENAQKLAYTLAITFNDNGYTYKFIKTTICVTKNLSYEKAQEMLNNKHQLMQQLQNAAERIEQHPVGDTHEIVSVFMVLANKLAARTVHKQYGPNTLIRYFNVNKTYMHTEYPEIQSDLLLKANVVHSESARYCLFGENDDDKLYVHFTSPIRRYVDILIHRILSGIDVNVDELLLNHINDNHSKYKKCTRNYELINTIEKFVKVNDCVKNVQSIIIGANKEKQSISFVIPELDNLIITRSIVRDRIKHLINFDYDGTKITIKYNNENELNFRIFDKIEITIAFTMKTVNKIQVKMQELILNCGD